MILCLKKRGAHPSVKYSNVGSSGTTGYLGKSSSFATANDNLVSTLVPKGIIQIRSKVGIGTSVQIDLPC